MTSPEPSDGKSFVSANLAVAFAQENKKVLLIDSDLRKGRQHRIFKVENDKTKGYSNLILSSKDETTINKFVIKTSVKNVDLLPVGVMPPNPSELLASTNNAELITKLRKMYGSEVYDHYTYCLCGDGCLEEGISQEALTYAGYMKLNILN